MIPNDWALRAPNFQGHPTASPARPLRAPQPNATSGARQRSTVDEVDSAAKFVDDLTTCKSSPNIKMRGFEVQLLTTMLDIGNVGPTWTSDSQPVQDVFLRASRKEKPPARALFFCQTWPLSHMRNMYSSSCQQVAGIYSVLMSPQVGSVMISFTHIGRKQAPQESWRNHLNLGPMFYDGNCGTVCYSHLCTEHSKAPCSRISLSLRTGVARN